MEQIAYLPEERAGRAADAALEERRSRFVESPVDPASYLPPIEQTFGGVRCRVLHGGDSATIFYLHGGGYRMGSAAAYTAYGTRLARAAEATVVLVDYRLAPENPFPAALVDAAAAFGDVAGRSVGPVHLAGDSAGAGLAVGLALVSAQDFPGAVAGMALLSPWLDLRCVSEFYGSSRDPLFALGTAVSARDDYLQGHPMDDPLVSPLLAPSVSSLPRALVQVGSGESLLGEALEFTGRLAADGVSCALQVVADQGHTWPLVYPDHPDSSAAIESIAAFVTGARPLVTAPVK